MDRHCANAAAVVELLSSHPAVEEVLYPGLPDCAGHGVATKQMRDFGGMVSFLARGGQAAAYRIVAAPPGCSPWPSPWAGWSPSSSTPGP